MSIAGIPPFNGFWSKLIIIIACVQAGRYGYAVWAVLASVLTLASFMKVMKYAFFDRMKESWEKVKEVPIYMKLSMCALALICIAGGVLLFGGVRQAFLGGAADALTEGVNYAAIVFKGIG